MHPEDSENHVGTSYLIENAYTAVIPFALFLAFLLFVFAPFLAHPPDPSMIEKLFVERARGECQPDSLKSLRYLLIIGTTPVFFIAWISGAFLAGWRNSALRIVGQILFFGFFAFQFIYQIQFLRSYVPPIEWLRGNLQIALLASFLYYLKKRGWIPKALRSPRFAMMICVFYIALRELPILYSDFSIADSLEIYQWHLPFTLNEFASVLNGRTNWVNYFPIYQNLTPYLLLPIFSTFGLTTESFTLTMALLSIFIFMLVYRVFVQFTRDVWGASVLLLLLVGMCAFPYVISGNQEINPLDFQMIPLRYLGPWILFYLAAFLSERQGRLVIPVFVFGTFVAMNNLNFGIPAFGAAFLALLVIHSSRLKFIFQVVISIGIGLALVSGFTYLRSGELPQFGVDLMTQKAYGIFGYASLAMPPFGIQWIIVAIFMGALVTGWFKRNDDPLRSVVFIYSGVFGAGSFFYYVGRADSGVLISLFGSFGLSFLPLLWCEWEKWKEKRRVGVLTVSYALVVSFLLPMALRLPSIPGQISRLESANPSFRLRRAKLCELIGKYSKEQDAIAIIYPYGHLLAEKLGMRNVSPYSEDDNLILISQIERLALQIKKGFVKKVYGKFPIELAMALKIEGFKKIDAWEDFEVWSYSDVTLR